MTHIALLRGINVGGRNRLSMADLVRLFEEAGAKRVRTYIQSGNVVFDALSARAGRLAATVSAAIAAQIGPEVPIVTRTAADLARIVDASPFARAGTDLKLLHVGFLAACPAATAIAALDPDRSPPDEFALRNRELYLRCPNGMARTKLTSAYFDATLKTVTTIRNWRTTLKLLEMVGA
ncbi:MAG: DUF1697 domain-containing protein [Vicinamibacterales bacterium]|jgi:uncharacterized protein (DUF1697 family)|nr:DUF1697 domain-containing protein [Vicinamibacterales bacterium]